MSARTIEAGRIAGALKCMDALRKLDHDAAHAEKQEAALLAAFRRMRPGERFKLLRATRRPRAIGK